MTRKLLVGIGLTIAIVPAHAQDTAITDYAQTQLESTLAKRRLEQAQARQRQAPSLSAAEKQRIYAACKDKKRVAAGMSPEDGRQLYRHCATLGY